MKRKVNKTESVQRMERIKSEMIECILESIFFSILMIAIIAGMFIIDVLLLIDSKTIYLAISLIIVSFVSLFIGSLFVNYIRFGFSIHVKRIDRMAGKLTDLEKDKVKRYIEDTVELRLLIEESELRERIRLQERANMFNYYNNPVYSENNINITQYDSRDISDGLVPTEYSSVEEYYYD